MGRYLFAIIFMIITLNLLSHFLFALPNISARDLVASCKNGHKLLPFI